MLVVSMGIAPELVAAFTASVSCSNIIIDGCSVIASSKYGAGMVAASSHKSTRWMVPEVAAVGGITINSSSVTASSTNGAGIGGGGYGADSVSDITINCSSSTGATARHE